MTSNRDVHPLVDFLTGGGTAEIDLTEADLRYADGGLATVFLPLHGIDASDPVDAPKIHLDSRRDSPYPIFLTGEPTTEFTRDQAIELATALLALVREHDARRHQDEYRNHRPTIEETR